MFGLLKKRMFGDSKKKQKRKIKYKIRNKRRYNKNNTKSVLFSDAKNEDINNQKYNVLLWENELSKIYHENKQENISNNNSNNNKNNNDYGLNASSKIILNSLHEQKSQKLNHDRTKSNLNIINYNDKNKTYHALFNNNIEINKTSHKNKIEFIYWINNVCKCGEYLGNFIKNGFDEMIYVIYLNDYDLKNIIGIKNKNQRKHILKYIKKYNINNNQYNISTNILNTNNNFHSIVHPIETTLHNYGENTP